MMGPYERAQAELARRQGAVARAQAELARRQIAPLAGPAGGQVSGQPVAELPAWRQQPGESREDFRARFDAMQRPELTPEAQALQDRATNELTRPLGYRLMDNLVGYEDGVTTRGENVGSFINRAVEAGTLGVVGDEAAAAADALTGRGSYDDRLAVRRDQQQQFATQNPVAAVGADIAGALAIPVGAATNFIRGATTAGMQAARAAGIGAAGGAVYGAMEGEGGALNRGVNAAVTAPLAGLFGAAGPTIGRALEGAPRAISNLWRRSVERPTVEMLRTVKNAAYNAVDQAGEAFNGDEMAGLAQRVRSAFENSNYVEDVDNASRAVLSVLDRRAGQNTTLGQIDRIRQNLWARYRTAGDQPQILDAIGEIDGLIDLRAGASNLMQIARAANARFAKSELLENAFQRAADATAVAGSGGNIGNRMRQAVNSILGNRRELRFFSADEQALMRAFVRGNTSQDVARLIGKLSPSGNGLMMALQITGGIASNGLTTPLMLVGAGAKAVYDRSVDRGASMLQDVFSGAVPMPSLQPQVNALAVPTIGAMIPQAEQAAGTLQNALRIGQGRPQ
jgi:hypothetical protein